MPAAGRYDDAQLIRLVVRVLSTSMDDEQQAYRTIVKPEWIDHNGHMNVAFFVVAFDEATDAVYEEWGLGLEYPQISGCTVFTLGMNVDYLGELFEGDAIRIQTTLIDFDSKRVHYFHRMYKETAAELVATNECLCMNVNLKTRRSQPFPAAVRTSLEAAVASADMPEGIGRTLGIRRR